MLNFKELIYSLDNANNGDLMNKIKLMFQIFSKDEKDISYDALSTVMSDLTNIFPAVKLDDKTITSMVDECFAFQQKVDIQDSANTDLQKNNAENYESIYRFDKNNDKIHIDNEVPVNIKSASKFEFPEKLVNKHLPTPAKPESIGEINQINTVGGNYQETPNSEGRKGG